MIGKEAILQLSSWIVMFLYNDLCCALVHCGGHAMITDSRIASPLFDIPPDLSHDITLRRTLSTELVDGRHLYIHKSQAVRPISCAFITNARCGRFACVPSRPVLIICLVCFNHVPNSHASVAFKRDTLP